MDAITNLAEITEYRIVFLDQASAALMALRGPNGLRLPRVRIPKWSRPAEEIGNAIRQLWHIDALVLMLMNPSEGRPACVVAEARPCSRTTGSSDLVPAPVKFLDTVLSEDEKTAVCGLMAGDTALGPFAQLGWIEEAQAWIRRSCSAPEIEFTKEIHQYNAGGTFALVQLSTREGRQLWLKATGDPNRHERALTVELCRLFPSYLPRLVAAREDWNAWVTEDFGTSLGGAVDLDTLVRAVGTLAELQIESLGHIEEIRTAGGMDRGLLSVQRRFPEIIAYLEEAMRRQTSTKSQPLTPSRLRKIGGIIDRACDEMLDLAIPASLVNGDINLDNILFDGARFRFTDWAEGGIGNPFLTLQQVIQHVIRDGQRLDWAPALRNAYKQKWLPLLTEQQIDRAFRLMTLLTMAGYLYGRGDWLYSLRGADLGFQSFTRTIARCMDRAVEDLLSLEALAS